MAGGGQAAIGTGYGCCGCKNLAKRLWWAMPTLLIRKFTFTFSSSFKGENEVNYVVVIKYSLTNGFCHRYIAVLSNFIFVV